MLDNILNLGKVLTKAEQRNVFGGFVDPQGCSVSCNSGYYACCDNGGLLSHPSCDCFKVGESHSCDYGGSGSSSCSVTND